MKPRSTNWRCLGFGLTICLKEKAFWFYLLLLAIKMCRLFWYQEQAKLSAYRDRRFSGTQEEFDEALRTSSTVYIGNVSFYTTEEQIYELFSRAGEIKKIIMGLDKNTKTPCGFCFVLWVFLFISPRVCFISWWLCVCVCCYQVLLERGHWGCSQVYKWHHSRWPPYTCGLWLGLPRRKAMGSW